MKYFLDQEFHERMYKPLFGKEHHIIELISIGIVCEDNREYYAISNEFDLKAAWNNEWLRENVLKPIHNELCSMESVYSKTYHWELYSSFTLKSMKTLIKWRGKNKIQIANEIIDFVSRDESHKDVGRHVDITKENPEFYGYYADYDWVVFCSLFGSMMNLPDGFPMYCIDLKQTLDEEAKYANLFQDTMNKKERLELIKCHKDYPKQENEHNALADANWNKKLYDFLINQ
jgi:hypothetical protein